MICTLSPLAVDEPTQAIERIEVRICDLFGFYLIETNEGFDFTRNKAEAKVFDYHEENVVDLVTQAARQLGVQWCLDPVDEGLRYERCDVCKGRWALSEVFYTKGAFLCEGCCPEE